MPIQDYLDPRRSPADRPSLSDMDPRTRELHQAIDDHMRATGLPSLHPDSPSLQLDLLGSPNVASWQENKAAFLFAGEGCWSTLPQIYARYGTETTRRLILEVCRLENASAAIVSDCGLQASALLFDTLVSKGSRAIIGRQSYNKTKTYLSVLCDRVGAEHILVDDGDLDALDAAIDERTTIVFLETFSNPLTRAIDPARLSELIETRRAGGCRKLRLAVDDTIATPWGLRSPLLDHPGIDFIVASGTKALGGQDQDLWGYVASNRIDPLNEIMDLQAMRGGILDWRRAAAILAHLPEASAHHAERCENASRVAHFLSTHPHVPEVFHPSLPSHPDHATIEASYTRPGSLLSFRVEDLDEAGCRHFCDVLATTLLPRYALSFDGLVTKLNHHRTVSEYFTPPEDLARAGIDRLARLGIGLEHPDDLIACLNWALWHHRELSPESLESWRRERARDLGIYPDTPPD